jgi:sulfotransferase family protein
MVWPGAHSWRELAVAYPQAKVILSVRPEAYWWASFSKTIGTLMSSYTQMPLPPTSTLPRSSGLWCAEGRSETHGMIALTMRMRHFRSRDVRSAPSVQR